MTKPKKAKTDKKDEKIAELTADLQRIRADFENYRKRVDEEKSAARIIGAEKATLEMLPVIDNIERAIGHTPQEICEHAWVKGVNKLASQLDKTLEKLGVSRIDSKPGTVFNPELHQAVQMNEDVQGENEVIESELQAGYTLNGRVIRHAMVRVTRK